jgi:hypothetical protein
MKPLILWARDKHPAPYVLRIRERSHGWVEGTVKIDGVWKPFSFDERALEIRIGLDEEASVITIDEWGWEQ